jgi:hypothetical protein
MPKTPTITAEQYNSLLTLYEGLQKQNKELQDYIKPLEEKNQDLEISNSIYKSQIKEGENLFVDKLKYCFKNHVVVDLKLKLKNSVKYSDFHDTMNGWKTSYEIKPVFSFDKDTEIIYGDKKNKTTSERLLHQLEQKGILRSQTLPFTKDREHIVEYYLLDPFSDKFEEKCNKALKEFVKNEEYIAQLKTELESQNKEIEELKIKANKKWWH